MANGQPTAQEIQQQNAIGRIRLLTTGISMVKQLAVQNAGQNETVKIPLLRMGIMTGVLIQFKLSFAVTTANASTVITSLVAPWNLINKAVYNDFNGVQRVNANGYQLWLAQSMKNGDALSAIPEQPYSAIIADLNYDTNILQIRRTQFGADDVNTRIEAWFSLYVPMAYDPTSDLTGAVLTQTNVGEHYINLNIGNVISAADPWGTPFTRAGGVPAYVEDPVLEIEPYQLYIQPQALSAEMLPLIDLSTIYGFEGAYETSANINSGMDTYINYPNNRTILSALVNFVNGGSLSPEDATDKIGKITILANSNTEFKTMSPRFVRETMRNTANFDAAPGSFYFSSRRQPILTMMYANVQAKFGVTTAEAGNTKFVSQYEVTYPSGAPLPGITIAA